MKKLKIDKIKLSKMPIDEQKHIQGGYDGLISVVSIITVSARTMNTWPGCYTDNCLTNRPGTQDSCGLCTTNHAC